MHLHAAAHAVPERGEEREVEMTTTEPAIAIDRFTKRFGRDYAVRDLSLEVAPGTIVGLLGLHGAGKSTTLRALLNLVAPTSGTLRVLGLDSVRDSFEIRRRVGFVSERSCLYPWMTVREAVWFVSRMYDTWDEALASSMIARLELPFDRRLCDLSRGMRATVDLVLALAPRPEILVLDDPTAGLDPLVRRDFLETVIANLQSEGGTVFYSTHLLQELESVADEVAILDHGQLMLRGTIAELKSRTKKLRVVYPDTVPERFGVEALLHAERGAHHAMLTVSSFDPGIEKQLLEAGAESVEVIDLSLDEIFVQIVTGAHHD